MRVFKKIISWVFIILAALMYIVQVIAFFLEGSSRETLVVVSEAMLAAWFLITYYLRKPISLLLRIVPNKAGRFVLLGVLSTMFAETVYIFSKPMHPNLFWDLLLTLPCYTFWMIIWYIVLKKYNFSVKEAFILGGFHGFIIEGVMNGILFDPFQAIFWLPLFVTLYGLFFIVPYVVLKNDFTEQRDVSLIMKIGVSLLPLLGYIPGFIWILIWVKVGGIALM